MKRAKSVLKITGCIFAVFFLFSCNPLEKSTQSNSILIVSQVLGTDIEGNEANFLQSDVVRIDPTTNLATVNADSAKATLRVESLNPNQNVQTSLYNDIMITRYVVTYTRSDGKNTPRVDVPYSFQGTLSTLISVGSSIDISFIIVREVAKLEPPLLDLAQAREEGVLQVNAQVDFYGHDMVNNKVTATGYLTIFFANYVDL
ncbi:MAG: hypothetical protein ACETWK_04370 [Candidatus Aminicenantaceae bacterium]